MECVNDTKPVLSPREIESVTAPILKAALRLENEAADLRALAEKFQKRLVHISQDT